MCWRKLSCLFDVDAQKSSRTTVRLWRSALPSSLTIVTDDFFPNGGLVSTMSNRSPGSARSASSTWTGLSESGDSMPCSNRFMAHSRAVLSTISQPVNSPERRCRFWSGSRFGWWRRM